MAGLAELSATAEAILSAFTEQLKAQGVKVPALRYVAAGTEPVADGEQMTVSLIDIKQGVPGQPTIANVLPRAVHFFGEWRIILYRSAPTMGDGPQMIPGKAELNASGSKAMSDVAALVKAFSELHIANALTSQGEPFVLQACRPTPQQGGLVGTELIVEMSMR